MDFADLSKLSVDELRNIRRVCLQNMEAMRAGWASYDAGRVSGAEVAVSPVSYREWVQRKDSTNEELRKRGENITATGVSTEESRARAKTLYVGER